MRGFVVSKSGDDRVAVDEAIVLGRTADCGVVVDDGAASRRHMEILRRGPKFYWRDLGSTNGTIVNGRRMLEGELRHGDEIQIGETRFVFEVEAGAADAPEVAPEQPLLDSTVFKETVLEGDREVPQAIQPSKAEYLLKAVYEVMNDIATNYEPCSLVDRILVTTMKAIDAQRGAVLFAGTSELLEPCPVCNHIHVIENNRLRAAERNEIKISHTVVDRVLRGGESVLYRDTGEGDLNVSESIMSLKLRSIICVPLRGKTGVIGVLYVDSTRTNKQYTHEDMLLSTAVGNSAGLALENAQMHRQILEKQRVDQEIEHAWTIQEGFLVRDWPADDPRFEVFGEMRPAKTVGGDFYDFVRPAENTVGILIGDVSGKGVPAALTMAQLLAEFRLRALELPSPAEVLHRLNSTFVMRSQRGIFCTMAYLRLNLETGRLTCANAGHHGAIRAGASDAVLCGEATGMPIGILEEGTWQDETMDVQPGESLLLYTDGIVEARPAGEGATECLEYGVDRVLNLARGWAGTPRALLQHVMEDVTRYCAPQMPHDDCTMIALRYLGRP